MAYALVAAGGTLYKVTTAGVATAITLPTGVTLSTTRRARMAVMGRTIIVSNGATRTLFVDPKDVARPLLLRAPTSPPILTAGSAGAYTGTRRARYSFAIRDPDSGALLAESPLSPVSASVAFAAKIIVCSDVAVSPDADVNLRRLYTTATNGSAYFPWLDLDGNTQTTFSDETSDAQLGTVAAPTNLGLAPGMTNGSFMTLLCEWKGHLWGVGDVDVDTLLFSDAALAYAWPTANAFPIRPLGFDEFGITGLMPRRDELGVARRNVLWKIVGSTSATFEPVKVVDGKGCIAPDSVVIIRDVAYFLAEDGLYAWDSSGIMPISDDKARDWFTTDDYFNRARFPYAVGKYNPKYHTYELHLSAAGSTALDRWVTLDLASKTWWGPHKSDKFTPTHAGQLLDANSLWYPVVGGSDGYLYQQNQSTFADQGTAIAIEGVSAFHHGGAPDIEKEWLDPTLISKIESATGNLSLAIKVGGLNASVAKTFVADLRKGRQRFNIIGPGRLMQMTFTESTLNQGCELYGYEVPWFPLGRK